MRAMWEKYYLEADLVLFVVDSLDPDRLDEARREFLASVLSDRQLGSTPIILVANKQDMAVCVMYD